MKRKLLVLGQSLALFLLAFSLLIAYASFAAGPTSILYKLNPSFGSWSSPAKNVSEGENETTQHHALKEFNNTLLAQSAAYIKAVMTPEDDSFPRLECPSLSTDLTTRYEYLADHSEVAAASGSQIQYFFALDLHQCAPLLPRLLGSVVETIRFLGPERCVLSIVEGRSDDGTYEILTSLRAELEPIGITYFLTTNEGDPTGDGRDRIKVLAELRNEALLPLSKQPELYSQSTTVIFLNDVAICMDDILELIHQRLSQAADMTCAMDWTYVGANPTFYDVWIARGMNGDTFFNIPEDGSWDYAWNIFWNNPAAEKRMQAGRAFQVFSCWNGATAFTAKPIIEQQVAFRSHNDLECFQGEPKLFCKDMWKAGYGKIAVVPSINLEYSDEAGRQIKEAKGYVSHWVQRESSSDLSLQIDWEASPPPIVKCMSSYGNQSWPPWDEGLGETNM